MRFLNGMSADGLEYVEYLLRFKGDALFETGLKTGYGSGSWFSYTTGCPAYGNVFFCHGTSVGAPKPSIFHIEATPGGPTAEWEKAQLWRGFRIILTF